MKSTKYLIKPVKLNISKQLYLTKSRKTKSTENKTKV